VTDETTSAELFARDLERTVDRFRGLALARLGAPFEPEPTRADAGRVAAQRLADRSATLRGEPARAVPRLADAAVGDQLAVCGQELARAAVEVGGAAARESLEEERLALVALRRRV
jgi:hypothetical protein